MNGLTKIGFAVTVESEIPVESDLTEKGVAVSPLNARLVGMVIAGTAAEPPRREVLARTGRFRMALVVAQ